MLFDFSLVDSMKFKLTDQMEYDDILDYVLLTGDSIDTLKVQSYLDSKKHYLMQIPVLFDVMTAFCKLDSPLNLHTIGSFKGKLHLLSF